MIKVLSSDQIREADQHTIQHEPIRSIDLMERASIAFTRKFLQLFPHKNTVKVFCGVGNNGGDGLAIARLLSNEHWKVAVFIVGDPIKGSPDFKSNLSRINDFVVVDSKADFPEIEDDEVVIDGIFGSGLSRPLEGIYSEIVRHLNASQATKVAIDMASGLFSDQPIQSDQVIFKPDYTFSFQVPKLPFFLPEAYPYVGEWMLLDIGLDQGYINEMASETFFTEEVDVKPLLPRREKFAHKNAVGNLTIVAGSKGKMGAAILTTQAAFNVGVGLVYVVSPKCGVDILQVAVPEAMVNENPGDEIIESLEEIASPLAIGPGIGTDKMTVRAFSDLLENANSPMVVDADALNILSDHKELMEKLPKDSILTPHPGEFRRLVGAWNNDFEKLEKLRSFCREHQLNVVLKGAYSAVCNSDGLIFFNSTGNPALATAGSGDVLTGIISGLLAQGLEPFNALKLGVYLHGLAGDLAIRKLTSTILLAGDVVKFIRRALTKLAVSSL